MQYCTLVSSYLFLCLLEQPLTDFCFPFFFFLRIRPPPRSPHFPYTTLFRAIYLDAIGKGYAADEAAKVLRQSGIKDGIVDLGGNIVVLGKKKIGIQNPKSGKTGDYMSIIEVQDCSVVTSGSYERNFSKDGKTYHHILNPKKGYPSDSGLLSATVIFESSQDADAVATTLFTLGASDGITFA